MISLLTVNIGAASLKRAERQLAWLLQRPEDVIILTETSAGQGTAHLLDHFRKLGRVVIHQSAEKDRGVAIVSKIAAHATTAAPSMATTLPWRVATIQLDTKPSITVAGIYVPSRDSSPEKIEKKERFLDSFKDSLTQLTGEERAKLVIAGDYNVVSRSHIPHFSQFMPFEYSFLEELGHLGLTDVHHTLHPEDKAHSWVGRGAGGYRYDYFHAGEGVIQGIVSSAYLHETRLGDDRITDHSAVSIRVAASGSIREDLEEQTLF